MSKSRASIFEGGDAPEIDVTGFAPKEATDTKGPPAEQVRVVSRAAKFLSRESMAPKLEAQFNKRAARQFRTGRNVQFNVKALRETVDTFYALSEEQGWVLGYTLQRAIEALQRELKKPT